jgi:chromosome segregation ATPase
VTDRLTIDQINSDQLDQLYDETNRLTTELADYERRVEQLEDTAEQHARNTLTVARERDSYRKAWKYEQQRRARAEAAIARVHRLADLIAAGAPWTSNRGDLAQRIRDAATVDDDGQTGTEGTEPVHNAGPDVRECAEADRRWWGGGKVGE